jgi:tetratricopeptide (TPR) repeat protein
MFESVTDSFISNGDPKVRNLRKTLSGMAIWSAAGLFGLLCFSVSFTVVNGWRLGNLAVVIRIFGYGFIVAVACTAVGGLFGFLFGIPRTVQSSKAGEYQQEVNTNLEQISDWLTKILVGVGLTQLNNIPLKIWSMADRLKVGFDGNQAVAACVLLNFLVCGFFAGYLFTRLFLAGAFVYADKAAILISNAREVAEQFTSAGQYKKAIQTLEIALAAINDNTPKERKRDTYEQLTYNYLYQDPPGGFTKVIELAKRYIAEEPDGSSAKLWTNLACAYGQQYAWEQNKPVKDIEVMKVARQGALDAIRQALRLEPRMISLLHLAWDPSDPTKVSSEENDLEVFYTDEEFKQILAP